MDTTSAMSLSSHSGAVPTALPTNPQLGHFFFQLRLAIHQFLSVVVACFFHGALVGISRLTQFAYDLLHQARGGALIHPHSGG